MSFGILIYPGVEELDFQGHWEMAGMWHKYVGGLQPLPLARSPDAVKCAHGMRALPDRCFDDAGALTHLLEPGGFAACRRGAAVPPRFDQLEGHRTVAPSRRRGC